MNHDLFQQILSDLLTLSNVRDLCSTTKSMFCKGTTPFLYLVQPVVHPLQPKVSKYIKRKPLRVSLNQTYYGGGKFLGVDREDTTQQISISYPIHNRFNIALGYTRNISSISSFSHNGSLIELSFPMRSF